MNWTVFILPAVPEKKNPMTEFKSFIHSLQEAIAAASDTMAERNRDLIERYFDKVPDNSGSSVYRPKTVSLSLPAADADGNLCERQIRVPLISLVPLCGSQIEKATLSADVCLSVEDNELQLDFGRHRGLGSAIGKLEIVISPSVPADGMNRLVEAYTELLSKQI